MLLVLLGLAGLVLVTGIPIARAAGATADGIRPASSAFRQAVGSMFRLEPTAGSGAADEDGDVAVVDFNDALPETVSVTEADTGETDGAATLIEPTAHLYDQDVDRTDEHPRPTVPDTPPETTKVAGPGSQLQIDLGPTVRPTAWKLPPMKVLTRSGAQQVDKSAIREAGEMLEHALAEHGVETRLVGMTIGPTVTRYELELGPGVKVARLTEPPQGHRVRDGHPRRPHPGADPWSPGDRGGGAQRPQAARLGRRHPRLGRSQVGEAPARGRGGSGHRRQVGDGEPGDDAPRAHRGCHRARASRRASTPS